MIKNVPPKFMGNDRRDSDDPLHPISEEGTSPDNETQGGRSRQVRQRLKIHPQKLGKYEIKEKLGTGGMGEVYRAYDTSLNRFVALKILYADNPDSIHRFLEEARIQAGLEHENICRVYEAGETEGKNYIAMQLIKGKTLGEAAKEMNEEERLALMCQVVDAMDAAHQQGLIHRDIKPANIMVEQNENGWKPFICDFGLARGSEAPSLTITGMILGTPPYMAPEQARSETKLMDARTDVYSLGATLYEVISGKPIYEGKNPAEILVKILDDESPPIHNSNPSLPQDLLTIIGRCVEKDPARRYQSARSLADDLRRYLQHEPITAKQQTRTYRLIRKARKNKATAISLSVAAILLLLSIGFIFQSQQNAERRAKLIAEFGNEVRFIESQLRSTYAAPLHDVRDQINETKKRLKRIETRISVEGKAAYGPGYEALGQCYIALGDYRKAQEFLEKAWTSGYQEPSTAYALGIVTGKSYQNKLREVERLPSAGLRKLKRKEAEEKYGRKAVDYLKKGSTHIESTLYVEALIAFYEKRFEDALKKSREAFRVISWPYEAKKLEGDIYLAIGKNAQQAGDYKKALSTFALADKAYSEAEELARSNEEIYLAIGQRFLAATAVQYETGTRDQDYASKAVEACNKALIANPGSERAYLCFSEAYYDDAMHFKAWTDQDPTHIFVKSIENAQRAESADFAVDALIAEGRAYVSLAELANNLRKDPRHYLQNAIQKAEKAESLDPQSDAFHTLASAYFLLGDYELTHGNDPLPALKKVARIYHEGNKDVSRLEYMQNVLGLAYLDMGEYKLKRGENPHPELEKSLEYLKRGLEINPQAFYIASNLGLCYSMLAEFEVNRGNNPKQFCVDALRYYDLSTETQRDPYAEINKGLVYLHLAQFELLNNRDPNQQLQRAIDQFQSGIKSYPELLFSYVNMGSALVIRAEDKLRQNKNPDTELNEAEQYLEKPLRSTDEFYEAYRVLCEIQILKARYAIINQRSANSEIQSARKAILESLRINPLDAASYAAIAQTYRWEAVSNESGAVDAAEKGLEWIRKSKEKHVEDPKLTALEGFFHLVLARTNPENRIKHAKAASESLQKALKMNPLLKTEYSSFLDEASTLLKTAT